MKHLLLIFLLALPFHLFAQLYLVKKVTTGGFVSDFSIEQGNTIDEYYLTAGMGCEIGTIGKLKYYKVNKISKPASISPAGELTMDVSVCDLEIGPPSSLPSYVGQNGFVYQYKIIQNFTSTIVREIIGGGKTYKIDSKKMLINGSTMLVEAGWEGLLSIKLGGGGFNGPATFSFGDIIGYSGVLQDADIVDPNNVVLSDGYQAHFINHANPQNLIKTTVDIPGDPSSVLVDKDRNLTYVASNSTNGTAKIYVVNNASKTIVNTIDLTAYGTGLGKMTLSRFPSNGPKYLFATYQKGVILLSPSGQNALQFSTKTEAESVASSRAVIVYDKLIYISGASGFLVYSDDKTLPTEEATKGNTAVVISPNPTHSVLQLSVPDGSAPDRIRITDTHGKIWLEQDWATSIEVSSLPAGIYHAGFISDAGIYWKAFVKL